MKRKITAILLALVFMFTAVTFTGCRSTGEIPEELRQTRTYRALQLMANDGTGAYRLNIEIDELLVTLYRRGNDITFLIFGMLQSIIVDGYTYTIRDGVAVQSVTTEADLGIFDEDGDGLEGFDRLIDLVDARLLSTGAEVFLGEGELEYERFELANGDEQKAYFNEDGELFGITLEIEGSNRQIIWHISEDVPDNRFHPRNFGFEVIYLDGSHAHEHDGCCDSDDHSHGHEDETQDEIQDNNDNEDGTDSEHGLEIGDDDVD